MQEFVNLQQKCLNLLNKPHCCGDTCLNNHYCTLNGCQEGDCTKCMNYIQRADEPVFHYTCKRITYFYILRFFNRFVSEIAYLVGYFMSYFKRNNMKDLYIVSLGCGPGSEIFGFLKAFSESQYSLKIHYEGHDLQQSWNCVQKEVLNELSSLDHDIKFFNTDLFEDYHGFGNKPIHFLILNYVLSDAVKYMTKDQKIQFVNQIVNFVIKYKVKNIIFNDINYYGHSGALDSGVQLMKLIISTLKSNGKTLMEYYLYFSGNSYLGNENWKMFPSSSLKLPVLEGNTYMSNVNSCKSKQIFINIK